LTDIKYEPNNRRIKNLYEFYIEDKAGNIHIFYSNTIDDYTYLYKKEFNIKSEKLKEEKQFAKVKSNKKFKYDRRNTFGVFTSPDKTKSAILSISELPKQDRHTIYVKVVRNSDLSTLWEKEEPPTGFSHIGAGVKNSYTKSRLAYNLFNYEPIVLSNDGFLSILTNNNSRMNKSEFKLFIITKTKDYSKKIDNQGKNIIEATIGYNASGNLVCAGFYTNSTIKDDYDGIIISEFDKNTFETIESKTVKTTSNIGKFSNRIKDIIFYNDGTFTLFAENNAIKGGYGSKSIFGGDASELPFHESWEFSLIHLNKNYEIEWIKSIDKNQSTYNYGYVGAKLFSIGKNFVAIYTDIVQGKMQKNPSKLSLGIIDKNGTYKSKSFSSLGNKSKLVNTIIIPGTFRLNTKKELVGFADNKVSKYSTVKFSLDKVKNLNFEVESKVPTINSANIELLTKKLEKMKGKLVAEEEYETLNIEELEEQFKLLDQINFLKNELSLIKKNNQ